MNNNLLFTFIEFTDSACSYRLKFIFVVKDHLRDGNSLPQLQSPWLRSTRGSRKSKYTEGVAQRFASGDRD